MARSFIPFRLDDRTSAPCPPAGPGNRGGHRHEERGFRTPPPRLFAGPLCPTRLAAGADGFPLKTWSSQRYAHGLQLVKTYAQRPHPGRDDTLVRPRCHRDQLFDDAPVVKHNWQQRSRRCQGRVLQLRCHPYTALASRPERRAKLQRMWALLQVGMCNPL